jgi:hypothetical protein
MKEVESDAIHAPCQLVVTSIGIWSIAASDSTHCVTDPHSSPQSPSPCWPSRPLACVPVQRLSLTTRVLIVSPCVARNRYRDVALLAAPATSVTSHNSKGGRHCCSCIQGLIKNIFESRSESLKRHCTSGASPPASAAQSPSGARSCRSGWDASINTCSIRRVTQSASATLAARHARSKHRLLFPGVSLECFKHADHGLGIDASLRAPMSKNQSWRHHGRYLCEKIHAHGVCLCFHGARVRQLKQHVSAGSSCNRSTPSDWHGNAPAAEQTPAP